MFYVVRRVFHALVHELEPYIVAVVADLELLERLVQVQETVGGAQFLQNHLLDKRIAEHVHLQEVSQPEQPFHQIVRKIRHF